MVSMRQQGTDERELALRSIAPLVRSGMQSAPSPLVDLRLLSIITRTVEQAVIPRLLLAQRENAPLVAKPPTPKLVAPEDVTQLVQLVMAREEVRSVAFVEAMHNVGIPTETLYLDLLAPTARQLGQMWVDDDCDFTDVTVGLFLLQNALRELGSSWSGPVEADANAPRILLAPLPGEQHTFGLSMVFDFFRRAGWDAWSGPVESQGELATMVRSCSFDVVGFSLACDDQLDDAARTIRLVRKASCNPEMAVMVGGPGFAANPALAALVGADGTATDGRQAVLQAKGLLALAASRRSS